MVLMLPLTPLLSACIPMLLFRCEEFSAANVDPAIKVETTHRAMGNLRIESVPADQ